MTLTAMAFLVWGVRLLAVSVGSQAGGLSVEVVAGDDVTLWCRHGLIKSDYLFWCKHTKNSVPVYISCRFYSKMNSQSNNCGFIADRERVEMEVNSENSSLTIRSVHHSDSGLYYCSTLNQKYMIYSSATYLQIRVKDSSGVYLVLLLVFGTVIIALLSVLLFVVLKYRKQQREYSNSQPNQENKNQGGDEVNYAALHFSNKKKRRPQRDVDMVDPHVLYSSLR